MESPNKSNKISEVVRLWRLLKKWRNFANSSRTATTAAAMSPNRSGIHKSISFLKRTISSLSSDDDDDSNKMKHSSGNSNLVPKGYLVVCIGEELERFIIPMDYLDHPAFRFLLREAEEEFGFQQTGVLRIPCDVPVFQNVVKTVEGKKKKAINDGGLVVKEQCRLSADETCGGLLLDGGEMGHRHLHPSRHHPWSPLCR
ncbi:hypothetical protein ACJRO7_014817 [Eucalyptus globulus]|uniref:Uncharacterized protein n=1 Tax=Eucalyptus globulus TaxID=34317 RepID=A0ABD3L1F0_EUCGL